MSNHTVQRQNRTTLCYGCGCESEMWTVNKTGVLCGHDSRQLAEGAHDVTHAISSVGFQSASLVRELTEGTKAGTHLCQTEWEASAPSEPLFPVQILAPLSSNPAPWERLCPFLGSLLLRTLSSCFMH